MYDIIDNIIEHNWITQGATEQQYIYMICAVIIILLTVTSIDLLYRIFRNLLGRRM